MKIENWADTKMSDRLFRILLKKFLSNTAPLKKTRQIFNVTSAG